MRNETQRSDDPLLLVVSSLEVEMKTVFSGTCEWCNTQSDDLCFHKDIDEGFAGRSYDVCGNCRRKENTRLREELLGEQDIEDDDEQPYGFEPECYMDADGYCSMQGTEHCDWECPEGGC